MIGVAGAQVPLRKYISNLVGGAFVAQLPTVSTLQKNGWDRCKKAVNTWPKRAWI